MGTVLSPTTAQSADERCDTISDSPRYRQEGGRACVDVQLASLTQLFDARDPAPYRRRDLAPEVVEYVVEAIDEIPRRDDVRLAVFVADGDPRSLESEPVAAAIRGHFFHEERLLDRRIRSHFRSGQLALAAGIAALTLFLFLAEGASYLPRGHVADVARQGLTVLGWVALWRPVEILFFDPWPLFAARRRIRRILRAEIVVRAGAPNGGT